MRVPRPVVEASARLGVKAPLRLPLPIARPMLELARHTIPFPRAMVHGPAVFGGVRGLVVRRRGDQRAPRLVYLHGGGYVSLSPRTHAAIAAALCDRVGVAGFLPDYRLAPEHPCPAAIEDALAAFGAVAEGAEGPVAMAGDSAGGGLALATAVALRDGGQPPPAALALLSPWVDLTLSGASVHANRRADALLPQSMLRRGARHYPGRRQPADALCSPVNADLSGLPPILIQAGANELLLSDAEELARRAEAAGVDVTLQIYERMWHVFQVHQGLLREADQALDEVSWFLAPRLRSA